MAVSDEPFKEEPTGVRWHRHRAARLHREPHCGSPPEDEQTVAMRHMALQMAREDRKKGEKRGQRWDIGLLLGAAGDHFDRINASNALKVRALEEYRAYKAQGGPEDGMPSLGM